MRVTNENYDEYLAIKKCEYQRTFPIINADALDVVCTYGIDITGLAHYQYVPKCKQCIGKKECKNYKARKY